MERGARNHMAIFLRAQIVLGSVVFVVLLFRLFLLRQDPTEHDPVTLTISMLLISFLIVCDRVTTLWMLNRKIRRSANSTRILGKRL